MHPKSYVLVSLITFLILPIKFVMSPVPILHIPSHRSGHELDVSQRVLAISLRLRKWTYQRIANHLKVSYSAARNAIVRGSLKSKPRSGRPRKTSAIQERALIRQAKKRRRISAGELQKEFCTTTGTAVCEQTIRNRLHANGLWGRVCTRKPALRTANMQKRLVWARKHVSRTEDDWNNVVFSDESKFEMFGGRRRQHCWRGVGETLLPECVQKTVKMVWGCIGNGKAGRLHEIEGIMTKEVYLEILTDIAIPSGKELCGCHFVFQQDNDPKHTAKIVKAEFQKREKAEELTLMEWPSQSPDLNPIELCWGKMEAQRRHWTKQPTSKPELQRILKDSWAAMDEIFIQKLLKRMPAVCRAVIAAKGGWISEKHVSRDFG